MEFCIMFSTAYIQLQQALRQADSQSRNFYALRDILFAAKKEVSSDDTQPLHLRKLAESAIDKAITYTYMRTNPMTPSEFMSMASTPISPFQRAPAVFSYSQVSPLPGTMFPEQWTTQARETLMLRDTIREALNIIRKGLHGSGLRGVLSRP